MSLRVDTGTASFEKEKREIGNLLTKASKYGSRHWEFIPDKKDKNKEILRLKKFHQLRAFFSKIFDHFKITFKFLGFSDPRKANKLHARKFTRIVLLNLNGVKKYLLDKAENDKEKFKKNCGDLHQIFEVANNSLGKMFSKVEKPRGLMDQMVLKEEREVYRPLQKSAFEFKKYKFDVESKKIFEASFDRRWGAALEKGMKSLKIKDKDAMTEKERKKLFEYGLNQLAGFVKECSPQLIYNFFEKDPEGLLFFLPKTEGEIKNLPWSDNKFKDMFKEASKENQNNLLSRLSVNCLTGALNEQSFDKNFNLKDLLTPEQWLQTLKDQPGKFHTTKIRKYVASSVLEELPVELNFDAERLKLFIKKGKDLLPKMECTHLSSMFMVKDAKNKHVMTAKEAVELYRQFSFTSEKGKKQFLEDIRNNHPDFYVEMVEVKAGKIKDQEKRIQLFEDNVKIDL